MGQEPTIHSLETIVTQGLCIGCGLCKSLAGKDANGAGNVRMVMNREGGERPLVTGTVDEPTLRLINAVCPGLHVEGYVHETSVEAAEDAPELHPIWGPTRLMGTGHATDPAVRFHASSGGALSALSLYLLSSGRVDFILHVAASKLQPTRTVDHLSFDAAQVIEGSGSRYGPAAPLADFKAVLDLGRPFAFVGKACDISAIRNYAKFDSRVDQLVKYTLNFYCGGVSEFGKTMDYVRKVGFSERDISHLRYRGDGCPGPMVMKTHSGKVFNFSYNEMWEDEARWQLMFRCKICPDSIGDLADITVADVWPGGRPDTEGLGFNGFIARTRRGQHLLESAIVDRAITITEPLGYDGLELAQGSHMYKKQSITARLAAMGDEGLIVPDFRDLRLDQAAAKLTEAEREGNYDGMLSRLRAGDNVENMPVAIG
ncbi:MAG: coenzyme hydrogenase [Rhodospirillales bacterium]|nr:coenzyme hydrogenase [Rhodospirillales bacterium]